MTLVWRPGYGGAAVSDPDAMTYLRAVEDADNQALEQGVQQAVNQFVIGCKNDGIWNAIKASCILAGARTLNGALVPLVGTAPTNYNFVPGDYNRETGLAGDKSTKVLSSNRAASADPQDNHHLSLMVSTAASAASVMIGSRTNSSGIGDSGILHVLDVQYPFRSRVSVYDSSATGTRSTLTKTGFCGISRSSSSNFVSRVDSADEIITTASSTSATAVTSIFARRRDDTGIFDAHSDARIAFYSIGESLDLAKLDTRVSALITAIGAAIP